MIGAERIFISDLRSLIDSKWVCDRLIKKSYWGHWLTRDQVLSAIANSECFGAYTSGDDPLRQIGFLRVVTDFSTFSSIMDVYVEESHRWRGIGRRLVETALASSACVGTINILSTKDAHGFYAKFGYETCSAMKRNPVSPHG